jgi:hypothetical protein
VSHCRSGAACERPHNRRRRDQYGADRHGPHRPNRCHGNACTSLSSQHHVIRKRARPVRVHPAPARNLDGCAKVTAPGAAGALAQHDCGTAGTPRITAAVRPIGACQTFPRAPAIRADKDFGILQVYFRVRYSQPRAPASCSRSLGLSGVSARRPRHCRGLAMDSHRLVVLPPNWPTATWGHPL